MRLEVWGLGHAGLVCATCLADQGHRVVGVDIDPVRIARLARGETYLREPDLPERVARVVARGLLTGATPDEVGQELPDASILCLPTPARADRTLDTRALLASAADLAKRLRGTRHFHTIIVRSTVPVHFTRRELRPLLEAESGRRAGIDFGLAMVPEFLREGHALADFARPSLVVLGADDSASRAAIEPLFRNPHTPSQRVSTAAAECFKLTNNAFHALKIGFANEVARIAHAQGIDGHEVLRLLCADTQLNLSPAYLEPGFAFGGACLEKDLSALRVLAAPAGAPLLDAIGPSNRAHLEVCATAIRARPFRRLGIHGVTNKAGSDDLRHSPALALLRILRPPPGTLWICDPDLGDDQAKQVVDEFGATLVGDPASLQRAVDLVVNLRRQPLPDSARCSQIQFARFWQGEAREIDTPGGAAVFGRPGSPSNDRE